MFIHLVRLFRMVQTAVTIRMTACLNQRRKSFWSILGLGMTKTMGKENRVVTRPPHALNARILCVKRKRLSIFGVVLPVDRILM